MTSNVVKCNSCNILINEVLAFVQTKIDIMDEKSLIQICSTGFTIAEISEAKKLLFDSVPNSKIKIRKKDGKQIRDLEDVITLLKRVNPDEVPIFVARDLHKLPPVCFDHVDVTRLLKDILILQNDVRYIKCHYTKKEELDDFRQKIENIKYASIVENSEYANNFEFVNQKRGAQVYDTYSYSSGPVGLPHVPIDSTPGDLPTKESSLTSLFCTNTCNMPIYRDIAVTQTSKDVNIPSSAEKSQSRVTDEPSNVRAEALEATLRQRPSADTAAINRALSHAQTQCVAPTHSAKLVTAENVTHSAYKQHEAPAAAVIQEMTQDNDLRPVVGESKWQTVKYGKKKNRFHGLMGKASTMPNGKFKSVDIKVPLFISKVSKDTKEEDITAYIQEKTNMNVSLFKMNSKIEKRYNSYKLYVPKQKLPVFLDGGFWPIGITYRRFVKLNYTRSNNGVDTVKRHYSFNAQEKETDTTK